MECIARHIELSGPEYGMYSIANGMRRSGIWNVQYLQLGDTLESAMSPLRGLPV